MSYSASIAHMFNLTFPFVSLSFPMRQTGISVVEFDESEGDFIAPRLLMSGNVDHLIKNDIQIS
jgi:hypothetical protein